MICIGIDPGLSGAIGYTAPSRYGVWDTPVLTVSVGRRKSRKTGKITEKIRHEYDCPGILRLLTDLMRKANETDMPIAAWLEEVHAMPGQGVTSMFSMGVGKGIWLMALAAAGIPHTRVSPRTWKKVTMQGMGRDKDASIVRCDQLFPGAPIRGPQGGVKDGRAEALLLAKYGEWYSGRGVVTANATPVISNVSNQSQPLQTALEV